MAAPRVYSTAIAPTSSALLMGVEAGTEKGISGTIGAFLGVLTATATWDASSIADGFLNQ